MTQTLTHYMPLSNLRLPSQKYLLHAKNGKNFEQLQIKSSQKCPGVWKYHKLNLATLCHSSQPRAQLYWVRISVNISYGISIWIWLWNVSKFFHDDFFDSFIWSVASPFELQRHKMTFLKFYQMLFFLLRSDWILIHKLSQVIILQKY